MLTAAPSDIPILFFGYSTCECECDVCCCAPASCPAADVIRSATGDDQEGVRLIFVITFFFFDLIAVTQWNVIMDMLHNVGMQLLAYCIMILVITCERHVILLACTVRSSRSQLDTRRIVTIHGNTQGNLHCLSQGIATEYYVKEAEQRLHKAFE